MKIATLAIVGALLAGTAAQAYPYYGRHGGYYGRYDRGWHNRHYRDGDIAIGVACAPEVLQGNVAATDRTLATLAAQPEFAQATQFKSEIKRIAAIQKPDVRAAAYFDLIGIDSSKKEDVANFIGAREVNSQTIVELERTTGLTDAQASKVASTLQQTLRGNLQ